MPADSESLNFNRANIPPYCALAIEITDFVGVGVPALWVDTAEKSGAPGAEGSLLAN